MNLNEYQKEAARTDNLAVGYYDGLRNASMGMVGEAAETLEHLKKVFDQGHKLNPDKLIEEAGDCLWYIAKMARVLGVDLEEVAKRNIDKLLKRYPNGFSTEASINREVQHGTIANS